jgi:hypothetical protein
MSKQKKAYVELYDEQRKLIRNWYISPGTDAD